MFSRLFSAKNFVLLATGGILGLSLAFGLTHYMRTQAALAADPGSSQSEQLNYDGCYPYLTSYIHTGWVNKTLDVLKLQVFLNVYQGGHLRLSGVYDAPTVAAVNRFQEKYRESVLDPWSSDLQATGFVYLTTQRLINKMICPVLNFPMPQLS